MATNPLSSLSYTNKDFSTIYVELLDIVKELSSKWDPSISNESDPGVILLKADAIIADKNNYNIDKNILELYPETVTQDINARNLYKQLAYDMPWYQSATTTLTFKWVGRSLVLGESITIPPYTMFTNEDGTVVYTSIEEAVIDYDHQVVTCDALEGTFQTLSINGSDIITLINLDNNNRIYLPEATVSENGVFIKNIDTGAVWKRVDNLQVHPRGNFYFEFGIDSRNSVCYIEFPSDADKLIGSGIRINYLVSQGAKGNVSAGSIDRFYSDISATVGSDTVVLNADVITLYNPSATLNGSDPQSLADAFRSYRRTAGTFNTLVTLRDYMSAIYNSGLVSNAIVSDRTTDVQNSYIIKTEDTVNPFILQQTRNNTDIVSYFKDTVAAENQPGWFEYDASSREMKQHTVTKADVESGAKYYREFRDKSVDMSAFDLKLYLLHYPGIITSNDAYNSTFELEAPLSTVESEVKTYIYDQQCVQHDFVPIVEKLPCLFKNTYAVGIKVVPQHFLTNVQIEQVKRNIVTSLWDICNSRAIDFGDAPDYDLVYDTILNCDERIKVVILDDFKYTTFATYWDSSVNDGAGGFKDIPISNSDSNLIITCTESQLLDYTRFNNEWTKSNLLNAYFIVGDVVKRYNDKDKAFDTYSTLRKEIQEQIIAKSVVAGRTPLLKDDSLFEYQVNHKYIDELSADRLTTALVISPSSKPSLGGPIPEFSEKIFSVGGTDISIPVPAVDNTATTSEYILKKNESVRFLAPSFETDFTYSNYVKFELILNEPTGVSRTGVNWSENIANNTMYQVDSTDYNKAIYNYISNGLVINREIKMDGDTYYQLIVADGTRCLCANALDNIVQSVSGINTDDACLWKRESSGSNKYSFINKQTGGYLTVKTTSSCTLNEVATSGGDTTVYDTLNPYTDYYCEVITCSKPAKDYSLKPTKDDYSCSADHYAWEWELKAVPLTTSIDYNSVVSGCTQYSMSAVSKRCAPDTTNSTVTQYVDAPVSKTVIYWLFDNTFTAREPDDVTYINFDNLKIFIDSVDANGKYVFADKNTPSNTSAFIKGMYEGTRKWLSFEYEKDKILLDNGQTSIDNVDYKGTAVIIREAWKSNTIALYEEKVLYSIPANCDYQLKKGDAIVFFWRTDDSNEDSPYQYKKYVGISSSGTDSTEQSPIIKPSFVLNGTDKGNAPINPDSLNNTGTISYGDSEYRIVYGMYGDNDLSGSKSIETRNIKQAVFDNGTNNYYFITNNITADNKYRMLLTSQQSESVVKPTEGSTTRAVYRYTLQTDEYFVRTNKTYTEYEIYYPGTMIGLDINYTLDLFIADHYDKTGTQSLPYNEYELLVPCVPYEDIMEQGISAFSDYCKAIPYHHTLYAREQQVHNVVEDNVLMIRRLNSGASTPLVFKSWEDTLITSDFEVSYKTVSGTTITLPAINIQSDEYAWAGRACLNLNTSSDDPQVLVPIDTNYQSVQLISIPQNDEQKCYPQFTFTNGVLENAESYSDVYLQSDVFVNRVGGNNIDISYINLYADRASVDLYLYEVDNTYSTEPFHIRSDDGKIICNISELSSSNRSVALPLKLKPSSNYMIAFQLLSECNTFAVEGTGITEDGITSLNDGISSTSGRAYYTFRTADSDSLSCDVTLTLKFDDTHVYSNTDILVFESLSRYVDNDLFKKRYNIESSRILEIIKNSLDIDNVYKYNNRVTKDDDLYIEDPLEAASFFNVNHIMNPYTIAKAELQLSQGNDSYITVVNNR